MTVVRLRFEKVRQNLSVRLIVESVARKEETQKVDGFLLLDQSRTDA